MVRHAFPETMSLSAPHRNCLLTRLCCIAFDYGISPIEIISGGMSVMKSTSQLYR